MSVTDESLLELGALVLGNPIRPEYASKLTSPDILYVLTERLIAKAENGRRALHLVHTPYPHDLLLGITANKHTPPEALAKLYRAFYGIKNSFQLISSIAQNPSTPPEVLEELSTPFVDNKIRAKVAVNPSTPPKVLLELAKSRSKEIRQGLASNPNTPPHILSTLAKSRCKPLIRTLAKNPALPEDAVFSLLSNYYSDSSVFISLFINPAFPEELFDQIADQIIDSLENDIALLQRVLNAEYKGRHYRFVSSPTAQLGYSLIQCPRFSAEKLDKIISIIRTKSPDKSHTGNMHISCLKKAVALNPHVSNDYLLELILDEDSNVRQTAIETARSRGLALNLKSTA